LIPGLAPRQEPSLASEYLSKIVGHRPHARNPRQVAADQQPQVALGQALSKQDLHQALITGHNEAWEERNAVPGACRSRLRRLATGPK
jgi:hypothetical protein